MASHLEKDLPGREHLLGRGLLQGVELARREIEPELHPQRSDGRAVVDPEPGGGAQIGEAQVAGVREDVARIEERDRRESLDGIDARAPLDGLAHGLRGLPEQLFGTLEAAASHQQDGHVVGGTQGVWMPIA